MHKIQEVLRLHVQSGLSERGIAKSVSLSRSTIAKIITRAQEAAISWPLPGDMDESKLESMLFPVPQGRPKNCLEPDWNKIHLEHRRKGVTLQLLWIMRRTLYRIRPIKTNTLPQTNYVYADAGSI